MADLKEGEAVEVQGSGSKPYVLKNVAGVLSCSCPAWRFQSLPIERRTCRHLRALRGDAAEQERVGSTLPEHIKEANGKLQAPPLLLAETWDGEQEVTGWLMSEKLDGVRAYWDGKQFLSRQGHRYHAPAWFTAGLPLEPLDGELWIGRKQFQRTVSIVRRQDETSLWKEVRFLVFDAPAEEGPFEVRLRFIDTIMEISRPAYARAHAHTPCGGHEHLHRELARIDGLGGEGLMLRQPASLYTAGRSTTLLKVKQWHDDEARVVGYEPGKGRHKGRLGALLVEMASGIRFAIGTGFTDSQREQPPPISSTVTFSYQELSPAGVPRFASFLRVVQEDRQEDHAAPTLFPKGEVMIEATRRFEFVGGGSDKFWEISVTGSQVSVRFGRNGTGGQAETKTFADATAAHKHALKKIEKKVKKGYVEVK
jgi:DNA ligase-1